MKEKITTKNGWIGVTMQFDSNKINAAMRYIYDTLERCVLYDAFILGDAGKAIYEGKQIDSVPIEVGIREKAFTPNVSSLFKEWKFTEDEKGNWNTSFEGIPITFKIIKRDYAFLKHPDRKFYDVDEYSIPNPFEKYYKARFIVR